MGQQFHQQFLGTAPEVGTEFVREKQGYTLRYLFTQGQFCSGLLETDGSQLGFETVFLCSTFFTPVVIGGITYTYLLQVQLHLAPYATQFDVFRDDFRPKLPQNFAKRKNAQHLSERKSSVKFTCVSSILGLAFKGFQSSCSLTPCSSISW